MSRKKIQSGKYKGLTIAEKNRLIGSLGGKARAANVPEAIRKRDSIKGGVVSFFKYGPEKIAAPLIEYWKNASEKEKKKRVYRLHKATGKFKGAKLNEPHVKTKRSSVRKTRRRNDS